MAMFHYILELFFPRQCAVCGAFDEDLCAACAAKLEPSRFSCLFCGTENGSGRTCYSCLATPELAQRDKQKYVLDGFTASVSYHDKNTQTIITAFKYRNHRALAKPLAAIMRQSFSEVTAPKNALLLPLPLAPKRFRERGYNQAALLARELNALSGIPVDDSLLIKIKHTPQQAKAKSREARFEQIKNAFTVRPAESASLIAGKRIILIDDVTTSGATLNEAARVLKESGARSVWGWVFAHG